MSRLAVFAYGSLVSAASAAETLGRAVSPPTPARLSGSARAWTLCRDNHRSEKTFARLDGSVPRFCLGLNLEPADGTPSPPSPNGALLELTEAQLRRLDQREIRYNRIEVTEAVTTAPGEPPPFDAVFTYRARPEHHRPTPPEGAIVIASYLRTVEAAFDTLGPGQLDRYRQTTVAPGVEIAAATLICDRIPPGNPRAW